MRTGSGWVVAALLMGLQPFLAADTIFDLQTAKLIIDAKGYARLDMNRTFTLSPSH